MPKQIFKCRHCGELRKRSDPPCCEKRAKATEYRRRWFTGEKVGTEAERAIRRQHIRLYQTRQDQTRRFRDGRLLPLFVAFKPAGTFFHVSTKRHDLVAMPTIVGAGDKNTVLLPRSRGTQDEMALQMFLGAIHRAESVRESPLLLAVGPPWRLAMTDYERHDDLLRVGVDITRCQLHKPNLHHWNRSQMDPGCTLVILANPGVKRFSLEPLRVLSRSGEECVDPRILVEESTAEMAFCTFARPVRPEVREAERRKWRTWLRDAVRGNLFGRKENGEKEKGESG